MNIFFLNVGRRCELVEAFARALPAVSPGLIWGSDPNPLAPALAVVDRCVELPMQVDSIVFLDALCDFLVRESIDLVIPTIDPDLVRLDQWRSELAKRAPRALLLLSPSSVIQIARDKRLSRDAFAELGAEVPQKVDPSSKNLVFPLFVKPASGSASIGAVRVNNESELSAHLAETVDPMVEQLVGGDETTVDVLLDLSGLALYAVPRRRLQVRGGEVTRSIVECSPQLEAIAMSIASGLGCIGPVTVQFRNPEPGRWVAMEINARMGGGLPLTIAAGANWPLWILEMVIGRQPMTTDVLIHDGMVMTRTDRSFFLPPKRLHVHRGIDAPLPALVVFDMDDTLYPEADFVRSGHRAVAERVWLDLGVDIEPELRRRFCAGQRGDLMSSALASQGFKSPNNYVSRVLVPVYREHLPQIRPYVETVPVLKELRARGHLLALLTDGWAAVQRRKFDALGIAGYFDKVVFNDDLGREAWKPSPIGFENILKAMNILGNEAIYVADNPHKDFAGPHRLNMRTVRIIRPGAEQSESYALAADHQPQRIILSLRELIEPAHFVSGIGLLEE
jgi:carbamoyl-phosphate synthase large subunit